MPQKQKLSAEEKAKVIEDYINNRISLSEAARRGGVAQDTISQWARNYEADGMTAFMTCKNRVYSPELKRQAVEDYLYGMGSQAEICRKYHIRKRMQLQAWIQVCNTHGNFNSVKFSGGGSYMKQGRDTTQEERIQIVKDCLTSGKNYGEMALKYKVSYQQVRIWTLRFEEMGETGLEDRRGKRKKDQVLRTELEKAQIEIEQLRHKLYPAEIDNLEKIHEEKPDKGYRRLNDLTGRGSRRSPAFFLFFPYASA